MRGISSTPKIKINVIQQFCCAVIAIWYALQHLKVSKSEADNPKVYLCKCS